MESATHKRLKRKFASKSGKVEVKIRGGKRLDAKRGKTALEVERSGNIRQALLRLKTQHNSKKLLRVPHEDLKKAVTIAKQLKVNLTITNLGSTKRRIVR